MNPIAHSTHIVISLIWAGALVILNYVEFSFVASGVISPNVAGLFAGQNIAIALANSYFNSKIQIDSGPVKLSETTDPLQKGEIKPP